MVIHHLIALVVVTPLRMYIGSATVLRVMAWMDNSVPGEVFGDWWL